MQNSVGIQTLPYNLNLTNWNTKRLDLSYKVALAHKPYLTIWTLQSGIQSVWYSMFEKTYKVALAYSLMKTRGTKNMAMGADERRPWRWAPMNERYGDGRRWTKNMAMGADERRPWRWAPMNQRRSDGRWWSKNQAMGADEWWAWTVNVVVYIKHDNTTRRESPVSSPQLQNIWIPTQNN